MSTHDFFCRTWIFKEASGRNAAAYPVDGEVRIGAYDGKFMVAWADAETTHVLIDLTLQEGKLTAEKAVELGTNYLWNVQIQPGETRLGRLRIEAEVSNLAPGGGENNLSGNWGAEAPPNDPPA